MRINLKPKKFTKDQIERLSSLIADIGVVIFASVVLPIIFDRINWSISILGLFWAILFFLTSLRLEKIKINY